MKEKLKVLKKINLATEAIRSSKIKKEGRNSFSNYDYFTPSQVDKLVFDACKEFNLSNSFNLVRDEFGIYGQIDVCDLDTGENSTFIMAMDIPQIKATNVSQQLGGAMTYTKRYLLMNIYNIVDNNLDFDTSSNTAVSAQKPTITVKQFNQCFEGVATAEQLQNVLAKYEMTKTQRKEIEQAIIDLTNGN